MEEQTPKEEGAAVPTPQSGMSSDSSAQTQADSEKKAPSAEEKPDSLKIVEEALGREFKTPEEAIESLKNLNSLVGDQTVSKQRKALEKLANQSNISVDELIEVIETQSDIPQKESQDTQENQETQQVTPKTTSVVEVDPTLAKVTRIEVDNFIDKVPAAKEVKDAIFAEALQTGKTVKQIWDVKYAPVHEAGKKLGAKKLQTTLEGQPLRAESADTEQHSTKNNFDGLNPATGKKWTIKEMEGVLGYAQPGRGL